MFNMLKGLGRLLTNKANGSKNDDFVSVLNKASGGSNQIAFTAFRAAQEDAKGGKSLTREAIIAKALQLRVMPSTIAAE